MYQSTDQSIPIQQQGISLLIVLLLLWFTCTQIVYAGSNEKLVAADSAAEIVGSSENFAEFAANVNLCKGNIADGTIKLTLPDGIVTTYTVVAGLIENHRKTGDFTSAMALVSSDIENPTAGDLVSVTVGPSEEEPECELWDFTGSSVVGGPEEDGHLQLLVDHSTTTATDEQCANHQFGVPGDIKVNGFPPRTVFPLDGRPEFTFGVKAKSKTDWGHKGFGFIEYPDFDFGEDGTVEFFYTVMFEESRTGLAAGETPFNDLQDILSLGLDVRTGKIVRLLLTPCGDDPKCDDPNSTFVSMTQSIDEPVTFITPMKIKVEVE